MDFEVSLPLFPHSEVGFNRSFLRERSIFVVDFLENLKRTDYCGNLGRNDIDREVILLGWVQRRRDLGGLIFVELRDREGTVQVVFNSEVNPEAHEKAQSLRSEF